MKTIYKYLYSYLNFSVTNKVQKYLPANGATLGFEKPIPMQVMY